MSQYNPHNQYNPRDQYNPYNQYNPHYNYQHPHPHPQHPPYNYGHNGMSFGDPPGHRPMSTAERLALTGGPGQLTPMQLAQRKPAPKFQEIVCFRKSP